MKASEFDICPHCGSYGIYGLRAHPKFSVKAGVMVETDDPMLPGKTPDLVAYYAHDLPSFKALVEALRAAPNVEIVELEQWKERDGEGPWWTEITI